MNRADLESMELSEYNVLIRMDPVETQTKGGIQLPESMVERNTLSADLGTLVKASPLAFGYAKWPDGKGPPQPGERVLIAQYDGKLYEFEGEKFRVCKDKSVVAWWPQPASLAAAA